MADALDHDLVGQRLRCRRSDFLNVAGVITHAGKSEKAALLVELALGLSTESPNILPT